MISTVPEELLARHFGHRAFRPGQKEAVEALLAGVDAVAVMPTGSGKSLCYQLPALALDGLTVVVSPLIALMKDQVDALQSAGVAATFVNSAISGAEQSARLEAAARGELRLLYVAPERFRSTAFRRAVMQAEPVLLAVDEAHCISEWGHDFRPDYRRLIDLVRMVRPAPVLACTATATAEVRADIGRQLGLAEPRVVVRGFRRPNLFLAVERAGGRADKLQRVLAHIDDGLAEGGGALVYCATRRRCEELASALAQRGRKAMAYHAGLSSERREEIQDRFMSGELPCVVATNAFGMGVDKADVRVVLHHELPRSLESYYQEIGRAGRDGRPARCVLLFNYGDTRIHEFLISASHPPEPVIRAVAASLQEHGHSAELAAVARSCSVKVSDMQVRNVIGILSQQSPAAWSRGLELGDPWEQSGFDGMVDALDFEGIERRAKTERDKLRRMVLYATGAQCRHRLILEYFGDPDDGDCQDACERCLRAGGIRGAGEGDGDNAAEETLNDEQVLAVRKALSAVARLQGRFGLRRVARVLTGSRDKGVLEAGLDALPTWGALKGWTQQQSVELLELLCLAGCIEVSLGDYPTVDLTARGREVMRDEERVAFPWPRKRPQPQRSSRSVSGRSVQAPIPEAADPGLFEALRDRRSSLAQARGVPAYVVATDKALWDVAANAPASAVELTDCHGFGPKRVERYGEAILEVVRSWQPSQ